MFRKIMLASAAVFFAAALYAQTPKDVKYSFTEGCELTMVGKLMSGTPNPYARVDTLKYKGFTKSENYQVRCGSGMAIAFKTNSTVISVKTEYSKQGNDRRDLTTMPLTYRGYDLYIKKDGKWLWAAAGTTWPAKSTDNLVLIKDMDSSEKECLLYIPQYAEVYSVKIGVQSDATMQALENPFRHRVAIWGSSFTQGVSTSRPGMAYPLQFTRHTGVQMLPFGCAGNCKMQTYFADVLVDVDADAFVFDCFSNPDAALIKERLVPFIDRMVAAHPGKPLIFQQTIYRERRNFNQVNNQYEQDKIDMAASIFKEIKSTKEGREKYKDVYLIGTNATSPEHETSVDGTHPGDYGYYLWARSIEKPILKILSKYGLK
ncbi:MAG: SGNH/GDSL hydrolase family protein [Bacteroidales bacterium]|nr:SGNH/GDSL hydrolase family protein [Bacteroidales bacterium]